MFYLGVDDAQVNQDVYSETSGMLLWLLIHNYYDVMCRNNTQS